MHEVVVRRGRVSAINAEPGDGEIAWDTVVLVGRESGADELRQLQIGDPVFVGYYLASTEQVPFWFAVGGQPIVRDGAAVAGLNNTTAATRSAAGVSADGSRLYLVSLDRNAPGMTYAGARERCCCRPAPPRASISMAAARLRSSRATRARRPSPSRTSLPGDFERPVPNGIGIFFASLPWSSGLAASGRQRAAAPEGLGR